MAGLYFSKVAVVVVQVANQGGVIERRPVRSSLTSANQSHERVSTKVLELCLEHLNWRAIERPYGTTQSVQHADFEFLPTSLCEIFICVPHYHVCNLFN